MPTFAAALPVARQSFGIAKEVTKGTYVVPSASLPYDTFSPEDKIATLMNVGLRGSMTETYGAVQGVGNSELSVGGAVYADTIGWPLAGLLGVDTVTGSGPYVHALTLLNTGTGQPTSHSITWGYQATSARALTAVQWNSVEIQYTAKDLAKFTAKASGLLTTTQTNPTPSYTTLPPFAAWSCVATINGATTYTVTEATVTISRKEEIINGLTGLQSPAEIFEGPLSCTWKLSVLADASDTAMLLYLNNTQPSVDLTMTASTSAILEVHSTSVAMTAATPKDSGSIIEIDLAGTALANTTDGSSGYSPVKCTLTNSIATSVWV